MTEVKKKTVGQRLLKFFLILLSVIGTLLVIGLVILVIYAFNNLNYDKIAMKKVWDAGFVEKQVILEDGTVLNYGEGPDNGVPLLLIHGQCMEWEDYSLVLPKLSKEYHVYAIDCHGHGQSSHNAEDYTCKKMTGDFVWFIENVIGEPAIVSGHSSGGILTASIAATSPQNVVGIVLEDPPFFSVEPLEMQGTFVYEDAFKVMNEFVESGEKYYTPFYYRHSYFWGMFQGLGEIPAQTASNYVAKHGEECTKFWYIPHDWTFGLNYINDFDVEFAQAFFHNTWLEEGEQERILKGIECPCVYVKAKTSYGEDGILYCANSDEDAERMMSLIKDCQMITTKSSDHDIHVVYAKEFIDIMSNLEFGKQ